MSRGLGPDDHEVQSVDHLWSRTCELVTINVRLVFTVK